MIKLLYLYLNGGKGGVLLCLLLLTHWCKMRPLQVRSKALPLLLCWLNVMVNLLGRENLENHFYL